MARRLRIGMVRPRLGIGGAERTAVDLAIELLARGHEVVLHVPERPGRPQFANLPPDLPIVRAGAWVPESIAGRLRLPCTIARAKWSARMLPAGRYDAIVCDVVPHIIDTLKRRAAAPVLYYGHFPDARLAIPYDRFTGLYAAYRRPLDRAEARGLEAADRIVVNSRFTADAFRESFPRLRHRRLDIVPPGVPPSSSVASVPPPVSGEALLVLVPGRFDPRKNLPLALHTLASLRSELAPETASRVVVALAGAFDDRLAEVRALRRELEETARALGLSRQTMFVYSPTDREYAGWLHRADVVLFTPAAEHLGLVALEAGAAAKPVIAANRGGPTETVIDGVTGWLRDPAPAAYAKALAGLLENPARRRSMGDAARAHVTREFSRTRFGDRLESLLAQLAGC